MDCMVRASPAARVSCGHGGPDARSRTGLDFRRVSAAPFPYGAVFHHHALADRHRPDQQLRLLELPRAGARFSPAGRQVSGPAVAFWPESLQLQRIFKYHFKSRKTAHPVENWISNVGAVLFSNLGVLRDMGVAARRVHSKDPLAERAC